MMLVKAAFILACSFSTPTPLSRLRVLCPLRPPSAQGTGVSSLCLLLACPCLPRSQRVRHWMVGPASVWQPLPHQRVVLGFSLHSNNQCTVPSADCVTPQQVPSSVCPLYTQRMCRWYLLILELQVCRWSLASRQRMVQWHVGWPCLVSPSRLLGQQSCSLIWMPHSCSGEQLSCF